ncbi:hypothetical protein PF003_g27287 [Phytophthora fragariae]|nr:hypothetical protein PF003_g27287 [Phytophthora fragariae]
MTSRGYRPYQERTLSTLNLNPQEYHLESAESKDKPKSKSTRIEPRTWPTSTQQWYKPSDDDVFQMLKTKSSGGQT